MTHAEAITALRARAAALAEGDQTGVVAMDLAVLLADAIPSDRVQRNAPLAPLTTFKVGGPADWL